MRAAGRPPLVFASLHSSLPPSSQLHVFAKSASSQEREYAKVVVADGSDVGDLKKAIVAELKLDAAPDRVRLLREVEGGASVPLDSCEKLAAQGVGEGAKVAVEVVAPPPAPPPPAPAEHSAYIGGRASHPLLPSLSHPLFPPPHPHAHNAITPTRITAPLSARAQLNAAVEGAQGAQAYHHPHLCGPRGLPRLCGSPYALPHAHGL